MSEIELYVFSDAVRHFWATRAQQAQKQKIRGGLDQGARSAVTVGQQMDGFARKIIELMKGVGVPDADIFTKGCMELPGFYRPTKKWDLIVKNENRLVAVLEFKSQIGSLGNNVNNRAEEAIGSAVDIWTAYREKAFDTSPAPWLGFFFLLEDTPKARTGGSRLCEPHFRVFPEFKNATYARRYELLCRKLVLERQYNAACFLMADPDKADQSENYREPAGDLSANLFLNQLLRQVARS